MSTYIITGATGWIGRAVLEYIFKTQGHLNNVVCIASSARKEDIGFTSINTVTFQDVPSITGATVFHLAYLTKDKNSLMTDEEYITKNNQIRNEVARIINMGQKNFFYASSGAVYHMNGYTLYGELKLQDEEFFQGVCNQNSIKFLNARIFNIMGRHIQNYKVYAMVDFILQCVNSNQITISSKNHVVRSYINIDDLVAIIFAFFDDTSSEKFYSFDTAHATLNLLELAQTIKNVLGNEKTQIMHNINKNLKPNYYVGNGKNQSALTKRYNISLQTIENSIFEMKEYLLESSK